MFKNIYMPCNYFALRLKMWAMNAINISNVQYSGVTFTIWCPLLIFCRPHKFFTVSKKKKKKKKKKVATFFSVFLIGFLPPWTFLYPQIFFSRRPTAKLAEIWYILLLCQKIFRLKTVSLVICRPPKVPPPA